ncbi:MAG: Ig-like domain-containing domain [Candidatus Dormibacteria bacterium]
MPSSRARRLASRAAKPSRLLSAGLAGLLAAFAMAGCGPLSPPQITDVLPPPSQGGVHTNIPIEIVFSVPMNERSVETRLSIRNRKGRRAPGCDLARAARGRPTGCHFVWSDGGRVMRLVHPGHPLATVTTYRVNLAGGIISSQGAVNSLAHSWGFSTEGGPSLSSTYPANHGVLGPDQAMAINFNRAMNPASVARAVSLAPKPPGGYLITPNPKVPGRFLLNPNRPLQPGTTYTLTVTRSALDIDGNHLQAGLVVRFTVGKLGSTPTVAFAAGPSPTDYTKVLMASLPQVPGDPPALRLLASAPAGQHYVFAWVSPNGDYLASELAGKQEIQVVNLLTQKTAAVLGSTSSTASVWSPNSQQLAFLAGGALRVYTVATKTAVTLSAPATLGGPLAWRPDSSVLAAVAVPSGTASRIALLSPSLRAVTYLGTATAGPEGAPVWNQQGTGLAFSVGQAANPAVWLYQPADLVAPLRLITKSAGQPLAFLSSGSVLVRTEAGSLEALSPTTEAESPVVGPAGGKYPIAAAVDAPGRVLAYTRAQAGFVNLFLCNQDGTGTAPLTTFDRADALNAGPPAFVGA